ncbi:MAG: hypothetical protein OXH31_01685 [Gammaproteobacteria bacterium]|nr:hypothetical protein [Gammaproteobacteria bacterium]
MAVFLISANEDGALSMQWTISVQELLKGASLSRLVLPQFPKQSVYATAATSITLT